MKLTLYTKKNCPACDKVKEFINGSEVVKIVDITNDLVTIMLLKEHFQTFPILEVEKEDKTKTFIAPSDKILEFLQTEV